MKHYKLVVLGTAGVGKSALTVRFVNNVFVEKYEPTIEEAFTKIISLDDDDYALELIDTAGTELLSSLSNLYMMNGQGFILCYSIVEEASLGKLLAIRDQLEQSRDGKPWPCVLVGTKADLEEDRQVSKAQAQQFATTELKGCPIMETSALADLNVKQTFELLIRAIDGAGAPKEKPASRGGKSRKGCSLL